MSESPRLKRTSSDDDGGGVTLHSGRPLTYDLPLDEAVAEYSERVKAEQAAKKLEEQQRRSPPRN